MTFSAYLALVRLSLSNPTAATQMVQSLLNTASARWLALAAVITSGAALGALGEILFSLVTGIDLGPTASPVRLGLVQAGLMLYAAAALTIFGRQFGGQGNFAGAFAVIIWIQAILVGAQAVQVVVLTLFPVIGVLMTLTIFVLMIWLLIQFTAALHGFTNMWLTGAGVLAVLFGSAVMLGSVFLSLGLTPPFMTES
ncbi:hypothetical protein C8J27_106255 [Rhodobacter aestuarii]|uniref:Uncharacterized protein n=1 Tax=Rhodobacter aestuarii TaxID=453582 RepID=A0A1N7MCE0_9RHOB|nr:MULTISPECIES: YIP1 family protein [Rhodobacter]PTV94986.1 hypothetical protein C8J27_106255 [Rhodobacter aestuarii]SIS83659.1 hypothetical protein SAMN05421580_105255 [Rhodobacter aestuarii]SOB97905.1 hypothetical protein SAMN05877809_10260 [Rhodobacter sp. JA431]